MKEQEPPVILFDGLCNLCNSVVMFVIRRDHRARFRFAQLQSEAGRSLCREHLLAEELETFVLIVGEEVYARSDAALHLARRLTGLWPLLFAGIIIPRTLRDWVYTFVARNRYRWFGMKEECMIPTPELKHRFL